jgi:zinc protease
MRAFALIALLVGLVAARPRGLDELSLPAETTTLANGLHVVVHEDHRTPIVAVSIWYRVGSKDEPAGKNGFAHLFEHMMFEGSQNVPAGGHFAELEAAGATDINASTDKDRTEYHQTVPTGALALALWLESDRMRSLLEGLDEAKFETQRRVVENEWRQNYMNAPYGLLPKFIHESLYPPDHPYFNLTIGSPHDLDAATLGDARAFFRTWYLPNNATLVMAGDVDRETALAAARRYFESIPGRELPARRDTVPFTPRAAERIDVAVGAPLVRVNLSWPTPAAYAPGDAELEVLAQALAGGEAARLRRRLVRDLGIASKVEADQDSAKLGSIFEIEVTARHGRSGDEIVRALHRELAAVREGGVTDAELARAKTAIVASLAFGVERASTRARLLNEYAYYTGDPSYLARDAARYEDVTSDAVRQAARRLIPEDYGVQTIATPTPGAPLSGQLTRRSALGRMP